MSKLTGYSMGLIALLAGATRDAGAATLSEMRMINASQKPGMVVTCNRTSEIPQKGGAPVRIETLLTGVVLQNDGDSLAFDVTFTQRHSEQTDPFRTEKYRLTTELEATRQKLTVDPETIELSLPNARGLEETFLAGMKARSVSYDDYSRYRVLSATDYQILPGPDSPDAPVMHCTVRSASN
ncbi:Uncharacterised protein [Citrobacter amalonaticus]|uniref:hypothetical protein n=1 Tax=Citrobacter amalonaticus TaxID=35703 RepID=UPI000E19B84B|nr:hypothetical protein [Citrobacter amalonaticus]UBI22915.1 hypothetical protein LA348_23280 [Citrobacter amalonaticus]BCU50868.1 hypothetical protein CIAM_43890 [Citrobacter amalonaticus]STA63008.1 Uncharacterised protein [Citrobacter amalonaticus]